MKENSLKIILDFANEIVEALNSKSQRAINTNFLINGNTLYIAPQYGGDNYHYATIDNSNKYDLTAGFGGVKVINDDELVSKLELFFYGFVYIEKNDEDYFIQIFNKDDKFVVMHDFNI